MVVFDDGMVQYHTMQASAFYSAKGKVKLHLAQVRFDSASTIPVRWLSVAPKMHPCSCKATSHEKLSTMHGVDDGADGEDGNCLRSVSREATGSLKNPKTK